MTNENENLGWIIGFSGPEKGYEADVKATLVAALASSEMNNFIAQVSTTGTMTRLLWKIDGTKALHDFARDQTLNVARLPEYRETSDANIKRTVLAIVSETAKSAAWRAAWNAGCDAERGPAYDRAYHAAIEDANARLTARVMQAYQGAGR